jgi:hypothetical protein
MAAVFPTNQVQQLESFIAKIQEMAGIGVETVCYCAEKQGGQLRRRHAVVDCREDSAFGAVPVANHSPIAEPTLERFQRQVIGFERLKFASRRLFCAVRGDALGALVERQVGSLFPQMRHHIGHRRQDS